MCLGLAQAAVHLITTSKLITNDLLDSSGSESLITGLEQKLNLRPNGPASGAHPLSILERMLKDQRLEPPKPSGDLERYFDNCIEKLGSTIKEHALTWRADTSSPTATENSLEELIWAVSVVYGIGGFRKDKPFQADFFTYA